ncbi:MAG: hypothetical protein Q9218_000786 [Villophora microphyllina]
MSSYSKVFKRPRSKSEKAATPPKTVFDNFNSAYESIGQKSTPGTPREHQGLHEGVFGSVVQSSQSNASPSVPLLDRGSPEVVRTSHSSRDLFLPDHFEPQRSSPDLGQAWDPFVSSSTAQNRDSITTLEFKTHVLDDYFGITAGKDAKSASPVSQENYTRGTNLLASQEYPELGTAQLEAISKLSGVNNDQSQEHNPLDRCGTVQRLSKRHEYGQVETNADIHSLCGAHSTADESEEDQAPECLGGEQAVQQVEWSPRQSEELAHNAAAGPPVVSLPKTPKGKGVVRYPHTHESEEVSHSPESYENTRKLLELSLPRFPPAVGERDDFFQDLLTFAREGQSSSSHATSAKSYAKFSIEGCQGPAITRPVSQGEFQQLEQVLSAHMRRRDSRPDAASSDTGLVHVGQISLQFSDGSGADYRTPSSQTVSLPTNDTDDRLHASDARPPFRTRNGTPPLLFATSRRSRTETDWETVGDTNDLTESIADYSDTVSRSPPKESRLRIPSSVVKHPAHPRYNHSWDLQQDLRSGQYVLTPRYELSANSLFPHRNAIEPLTLRKDSIPYSHPTPLTTGHSHPFASTPPQISPSRSAGARVATQHSNAVNTNEKHQSSTSLSWLSTTADSISRALTGGRNSLSASNTPPVPKRSPFRKIRGSQSERPIELAHRKMEPTVLIQKEGTAMAPMASGMGERSNQVRMGSPLRHTEYADTNELLNPFGDQFNPRDSAGVVPPPSNAALSAASGRNDTPTSSIGTNYDASGLQPSEYSAIDGTPHSQARYVGSRSNTAGQSRRRRAEDLEENMTELREMIPPLPPRGPGPRPGHPVPRPFIPTPHPLHGSVQFRPGSPHLYHMPPRQLWTPVQAEDRLISRRYLIACAFIPPLLLLYRLGALDWVMRSHSSGRYRAFTHAEKQWAVVLLVVWFLLAMVIIPPAVIIMHNYS